MVLSACETGLVKATHGNDVLGMVPALLFPGASTLVLSSWKVDAASTAIWMETFYREARTRPPQRGGAPRPGGCQEAARIPASFLLGPVYGDGSISMAEPWHGFTGTLDNVAGKWAGYAAVGTFLLYLFGYLALRFQLYTHGVAVNLDAFDERYLFAGWPFLVFLAMWIPSLLLILTILLLPVYWVYRVIPATLRSRLSSPVTRWLKQAHVPLVAGCVLPLLLVQLVFRQCVLLSNMLLRESRPDFWISSVQLAAEVSLPGVLLHGPGAGHQSGGAGLRAPRSAAAGRDIRP